MPLFALWSAPRARSTAFFRSMLERGDLLALHEPFCNVMDHGETDVDGRRVTSTSELRGRLLDLASDRAVFFKDTTDRRHESVLADDRFLSEVRHAFLIRAPEEVAASFFAVRGPDMRCEEIGIEALHELHGAVRDAGGHPPVVVDSDDLVGDAAGTVAAFCAAIGLPYLPEALSWDAEDRSEWRRTAEWHADVSASTGFRQDASRYDVSVETSDELAAWASHHRPFYDALRAERLRIS